MAAVHTAAAGKSRCSGKVCFSLTILLLLCRTSAANDQSSTDLRLLALSFPSTQQVLLGVTGCIVTLVKSEQEGLWTRLAQSLVKNVDVSNLERFCCRVQVHLNLVQLMHHSVSPSTMVDSQSNVAHCGALFNVGTPPPYPQMSWFGHTSYSLWLSCFKG